MNIHGIKRRRKYGPPPVYRPKAGTFVKIFRLKWADTESTRFFSQPEYLGLFYVSCICGNDIFLRPADTVAGSSLAENMQNGLAKVNMTEFVKGTRRLCACPCSPDAAGYAVEPGTASPSVIPDTENAFNGILFFREEDWAKGVDVASCIF